jgi:hypothetical protein
MVDLHYYTQLIDIAQESVKKDKGFEKTIVNAINGKDLKAVLQAAVKKSRDLKGKYKLSDEDSIHLAYELFVIVFENMNFPEERQETMASTVHRKLLAALEVKSQKSVAQKLLERPAQGEIQSISAPQTPAFSPSSAINSTLPAAFSPAQAHNTNTAPTSSGVPAGFNPKATLSQINTHDLAAALVAETMQPQGKGNVGKKPGSATVQSPVKRPIHKKVRAPPEKKYVIVNCNKCHWTFSTRNQECPMCATPLLMSEHDLLNIMHEYTELQGIFIDRDEAVEYMKAFKKKYKKLPDLDDLWDAAVQLAELEEMEDDEIRKLEEQKEYRQQDAVRAKMEQMKQQKLQERALADSQKMQREAEERKKQEEERIRKEQEKQAAASKEAFCPRCGASNPSGSKFCLECGQRID